jgi:hypothetical protein
MESNKKKPEWWEDPVENIRSRLTDISNRTIQDEINKQRASKEISKVFFKVRSTTEREQKTRTRHV